jgi:hypothetical protein
MNALAQNGAFWVLLIFGLLVLYVLPSLIGAIRRVESLGWLIVVNLLPSGVGWPAALMLAFGLPRRGPRHVLAPTPLADPAPFHYPSPETRQAAARALELILQADERRRMREAGGPTHKRPAPVPACRPVPERPVKSRS